MGRIITEGETPIFTQPQTALASPCSLFVNRETGLPCLFGLDMGHPIKTARLESSYCCSLVGKVIVYFNLQYANIEQRVELGVTANI